MVPALRRQRLLDLREFKDSPVYIVRPLLQTENTFQNVALVSNSPTEESSCHLKVFSTNLINFINVLTNRKGT